MTSHEWMFLNFSRFQRIVTFDSIFAKTWFIHDQQRKAKAFQGNIESYFHFKVKVRDNFLSKHGQFQVPEDGRFDVFET